MRFEVLDRDGIVKMYTEYKLCIYPLAILKSMEKTGYRFRVNGKRWKPGQEIQDETKSRSGAAAPTVICNKLKGKKKNE